MSTGLRFKLSWGALTRVRSRKPLSTEEWVTSAISLASNPHVSDVLARRLLTGSADAPSFEGVDDQRVGAISEGLRERFARRLDLIVKDRATARRTLLPELLLGPRDIVALPRVVVKRGRGVRTIQQVICGDIRAAMDHAVWLLLNEDLKLGERLRRCPTCDGFFFNSRSRRRYCSPEHMQAADAATARERVAASRAAQSVGEWRANQGRKQK